MQSFKTSKRIEILAEQARLINQSFEVIADIGTDHGYLPYWMFENKRLTKGILCDINEGPLNHAKSTFEHSPYEQFVEFRLGSGIDPVHLNEADLVFINGMGGNLIKDILSVDLNKTKSFSYYILQPMTEQEKLRQWLLDHEFIILWDHFIEDSGKHYEILVVSSHQHHIVDTNLDEKRLKIPFDDLEFGHTILKDQLMDYRNFLMYKQNKYQTILDHLKNEVIQSEKATWCQRKLDIIHQIQNSLHI